MNKNYVNGLKFQIGETNSMYKKINNSRVCVKCDADDHGETID